VNHQTSLTLICKAKTKVATKEHRFPQLPQHQHPAYTPTTTVPISPSRPGFDNMIPQQSSIVLRPKQKAEPVESAVTEQQWEEAAIALLRAEIDRMDAVAAASAAAASRDRFVTIDGLLYVKAWSKFGHQLGSKKRHSGG
jgi:hypothetical protein